jgi:hypothetical protein
MRAARLSSLVEPLFPTCRPSRARTISRRIFGLTGRFRVRNRTGLPMPRPLDAEELEIGQF